MCNIAIFQPKIVPPFDLIYNVVCNNPHGYGLIMKEHNRLQVIRECPKDGNDPEKIYKLLNDNKDIERILHVRWRTDGPIDDANTHPFTAYWSDKRQVYFMHNGVLNDFKSREFPSVTYEHGIRREIPAEPITESDSKRFNDEMLAPFLLYGKGDTQNPLVTKHIEKFWSGGSKGILVSNDQPNLLIKGSDWKTIKFEGGEFLSSNDHYFKDISRGPVYEEKKRKQEEARAAANASRFSPGNQIQQQSGRISGWPLSNLKDVDFKRRMVLTEDLSRILEDFDLCTPEGLASLENLTEIEIEQLVEKDPAATTALLTHLTSQFAGLYQRHKRATDYLKSLDTKNEFNDNVV